MSRHVPVLSLAILTAACSRGPEPAPPPAPTEVKPAASAAQPTSQPAAAAQPTSQPAKPAAAPARLRSSAGGLAWQAHAMFQARAPKSRMRIAEYGLDGHPDAEMTVYYFGPGQGGSVEANLDRWIGQFAQPDGSDSKAAAKIDEREVGALKVTTLDLGGTYDGGMPPMMAKAPPTPKTDYRVLGAIAEGPQGPVFFKLVGPAAALAAAQAAFDETVASLTAQ